MSEIPVPSDQVPRLVQDLGLAAGLLRRDDRGLFFSLSWFQNAMEEIRKIPSRRKELMALLRDLLGTADANAPSDRAWYPLPYQGSASGVYVVLPRDDSEARGTIGVGILKNFTRGGAKIRAYSYVPLFAIPIEQGKPVVTGSAGYPIELVLTIGGIDFAAGDVKFDTMRFQGDVFFSGAAPKFALTFNTKPNPSTFDTLVRLLSDAVTWINAVLADANVKAWLDQSIGKSQFTIGGVLAAIGILEKSGDAYKFGSLDALRDKSAQQIAELLFAKALQTLAARKEPIVPYGDGGLWVFGNANDYGLRVQIPDVKLGAKSGPECVLQLGKTLSTDTQESTWISRSDSAAKFADPGVSLTLVNVDAQNVPRFKPKLDLISLGADIRGASGNPLVNVNGVTLAAVEPRFLLSLDFANPAQITWGAGLHAGKLGLPLGNGISTSAASNPVAQNLLSSGDAQQGDKTPVNPTFSASISKVFDPKNSTSISVTLQQPEGGDAGTVWIPIQRAFGPLQCSRIGVQWPQPNPDLRLTVLFDGNVHLAALEVDLIGLSLGIPLRTPGQITTYSFDLQGLAISYVAGPIEIMGGLVKNTKTTPVQYDGAAVIKMKNWSIAAIGSYASIDGQPSMFVFARLGATLGGPPFFFVTGLCAGFGYNRSLRLPKQDEVPSFPLLAGITDPSKIGGSNPSPAQALAAMSDWIRPAQGIHWFAAGVQFTSFQLVSSNAVLVVLPMGDFQAALLGVSRIKLAQSGPQFAYAELGLSVVLQPSAGFFGATAILSKNSYVLHENCHLTGGFAFFVWFDGEHAGDFVVTLGGYHPAFRKPRWYPEVPRLGFSWKVNDNLTVRGQAYFALTPSCVMGGGALAVEFHSGNLRAWFTAHADFLFHWKPFYFVGSIGVSIGASYKLDLGFTSTTVSVELGAELDIWGPPTGGRVHIDWYIISFTISFGEDAKKSAGYLAWQDFKTLLPPNDKQRLLAADVGTDEPMTNVIKLTIGDGLISKDGDRWLVRADAMTFQTETTFPLTAADLKNASSATHVAMDGPDYYVAVRPMGVASTSSVLTLSVSGSGGTQNLGTGWTWTKTLRNVPAAMWDKPLAPGASPAPSSDMLAGRLVGIGEMMPIAAQPKGPGPIPLANLALATINPADSEYLAISRRDAAGKRQPRSDDASLAKIANSIAGTAVAKRGNVFEALRAYGYDPGANDAMANVAANVNFSYPAAPMLGAPWKEGQ